MLTKRIIPCLDVDKARVVKGINFINMKDAGNPIELAKFYDTEGADELVFLDITASYENRKTMFEIVQKVARQIFIPFTVGGGIGSIEDIKNILLAGADKVSLNTAAVKNPEIIAEAANIFGSQSIVIAIDAKKKKGKWEVFINGARISTGLNAVEWAKEVEELGAGEILLTSIDSDGTEDGFDLTLTKNISTAVSIPVIASGGAGDMQDFADVFNYGEADAALAASLFHFRKVDIKRLKQYLQKKNIAVRN